jgi:hypothetical protein
VSFKIEYASRRREVWGWYWRAWRRRLWKIHTIAFLAVAATVGLEAKESGGAPAACISLALALGFLSVAWMPIHPLLMFKSQTRTLEMNQDGISTVIGKLSVQRSWNDIQSVSEQDTSIIIVGRNGNAFIVPRRAFVSEEERRLFLSYAKNSVAAVTGPDHANP